MRHRWRPVWPQHGALAASQDSERNASITSDEDLKASIESFTKVYDLVDQNYADKLSSDKAIYNGAIPGMLRTLDPHSNFFDPKEFAGLREEQHGIILESACGWALNRAPAAYCG